MLRVTFSEEAYDWYYNLVQSMEGLLVDLSIEGDPKQTAILVGLVSRDGEEDVLAYRLWSTDSAQPVSPVTEVELDRVLDIHLR